jgi:hypothetical protein
VPCTDGLGRKGGSLGGPSCDSLLFRFFAIVKFTHGRVYAIGVVTWRKVILSGGLYAGVGPCQDVGVKERVRDSPHSLLGPAMAITGHLETDIYRRENDVSVAQYKKCQEMW